MKWKGKVEDMPLDLGKVKLHTTNTWINQYCNMDIDKLAKKIRQKTSGIDTTLYIRLGRNLKRLRLAKK